MTTIQAISSVVRAIVAITAIAATVTAHASVGLYSTGVDNNGNPLAVGATDPHYRLLGGAPAFTTTQAEDYPNYWLAPNTSSEWITPLLSASNEASASAAGGNYTYQATFDLTGIDLGKTTIRGNATADNGISDILINGQSTGFAMGCPTCPVYGAFANFTINSGFRHGLNTLSFKVVNGTGPTGLRVNFNGTGSVFTPTEHESESSDDSFVLPPHSVIEGKTLGEWSALWWKWASAIPATDNPLLDMTGDKAKFGDVGPVFFLAGVFGTAPPQGVVRTVTIPAGKYIFFPLENGSDDNVGNGCTAPSATPCPGRLTIDQLVAQLAGYMNVTALHASIDGTAIANLWAHREIAPVFSYTYPMTDNLWQTVYGYEGADAAGTIFPAVADGYYLMLRPLPPGQHTINFGGTFGDAMDITYQVTVTPKVSPQPVLLVP